MGIVFVLRIYDYEWALFSYLGNIWMGCIAKCKLQWHCWTQFYLKL